MAALINFKAHLHVTRFTVFPTSNSFPLRRLRFPSSSETKLLAAKDVEFCRLYRSGGRRSFCCFCQTSLEKRKESDAEESERPPFDLNLAVVLAGFAFEAYTTPPDNVGKREVDGAGCQTVFLSESFIREIYDGQLFIKLKKGVDLPIMDPWGTSDPYVVIQFDGQVAKSNVKWATKEPVWDENFTLNIKKPPAKKLQVAAWDANLVAPHKRMGNAVVDLESLCDGNLHDVPVELEGMGGGGKILLEIQYKSFQEIDKEQQRWWTSFMQDFLKRNGFDSALKVLLGSEGIQARQFVESAFGQLRSLNLYLPSNQSSDDDTHQTESSSDLVDQFKQSENSQEGFVDNLDNGAEKSVADIQVYDSLFNSDKKADESEESDEDYWKKFSDFINQAVVQKLGLPVPEKVSWGGFELLKKMGIQSRRLAEVEYVESGLASSMGKKDKLLKSGSKSKPNAVQSSLSDIKKASLDLLRQTDVLLGALLILTQILSQQKAEAVPVEQSKSESGLPGSSTSHTADDSMDTERQDTQDRVALDARKSEEMRALFSTAESAMEAWAMLATALGRPSFIKSEFEKICFLDNVSTDTQVAIWRDNLCKRLVVSFRGTEQTKWKDLLTDLMLVPAGLNPERIGGDFTQELQVHSGFLNAYDSVKNRIISLIKSSIGFTEDAAVSAPKWHVYVTGHSLGGALATILTLELCSSPMARLGVISVTMYNFGSPRVGNRRFVEVYNEKVKDSWRVVNHRDIIPTVPRLMGYCHVAQPVYLTVGEIKDALASLDLSEDGYQGDVIGEYTPDVLVSEFMKGEKQLLEKILQAEINLYRSIRDGSALMQHMEDFYYITLLESVRSNYKSGDSSNSCPEGRTLKA
ncbi:hypothetical protein H6P81_012931 [Aristolochia fimbriata]|uniref:C2 domain-containing protein n=1 Tax=Aristolochia fimbriata TaxID=158543 RepID=A0AAV7EDI7_ARIFI|nr:hypothetical protein H6P81_012931 [Aristolochia fimbriata]